MKNKISVTLSAELVAQLDHAAGSRLSRSAFIEGVLRFYFREQARKKIHARDLERLNAADRLNAEAEDVLRYQALDD